MCFRTKPVLTPQYGYVLLHAYDLKKIFYGLGSDLRQNLEWGDFKYLPCLVPPLPEQTSDLDTAITCTRRGIDLLQEYHTRLIADVVTGKLDVREAALQLPNETAPLSG